MKRKINTENSDRNTKLRRFLFVISCFILASFVLFSYLPVHGEEKIYENMIRLHVIADSDEERDQALKLSVRDAVLEYVSSMPSPATKEEAGRAIKNAEDEIVRAAEETLRANGCNDTVKLEFGTEKYPVRYYDSFELPAGKYTSLRVVIGSGRGHNWWCVLFPPLCTASCEKECEEDFIAAGFTGEQYRTIKKESSKKYKMRFRLLEIIADAFGFEY